MTAHLYNSCIDVKAKKRFRRRAEQSSQGEIDKRASSVKRETKKAMVIIQILIMRRDE
jgi:hypothetical protein